MNRYERLMREARELIRESELASRDVVLRRMGRWPPKKPRPPGSAPALVEPPRGPLPLQGGAEAPLEFDS